MKPHHHYTAAHYGGSSGAEQKKKGGRKETRTTIFNFGVTKNIFCLYEKLKKYLMRDDFFFSPRLRSPPALGCRLLGGHPLAILLWDIFRSTTQSLQSVGQFQFIEDWASFLLVHSFLIVIQN